MISNQNPIKKNKGDDEIQELVDAESDEMFHSSDGQNTFLKFFNNNSYCMSLMDYIKKFMYISQIDFHSAYVQILYCFKPQEINEVARIRKRKKKHI